MIRREILGPQDRYERRGAERLRDTRPFTTRLWEGAMSEASGLVLAALAVVMLIEPAAVDVVVPFAAVYAALVLTRRVTLPLRLPQGSAQRDWNHPDPVSRGPRRAAGTIYLGRDLKGKELWIASEDGRQHATIPGTTGAGKTTAILSFLVNALTHSSGFVLVDGKADKTLYGEVLALARRFGREDDVLHLNLLVAGGSKASHTFNPFAVGNADAIREMVVSQLGEQAANDANGVFRSRAVALIGAVIPVLVWIRDHASIPIDIEMIRDALELRVIWKLAVKGMFEVRKKQTGETKDVRIDIPPDIVYPLQAYLGEIPGYDPALDYNKQKSDEPSKQHGYARFYFTAMFTQLAVSLGHIFKVEQGDIDMRDVVLNRRILIVSLPSLENSPDTLAGLGKIVVASLRGMMAQMLHTPANMMGTAAPFHVVLDELSYYASSDLDRMLAQGRSLNIMFWLAFQEVSGIWARLGEKTQTLLGNANLTVAMRLQEASRTREWIEKTAGDTFITQTTGYHGGGGSEYSELRQAEVRQVARVDWNDLQRLIEGEAIILFGGRRIYAKLFHARIDASGPDRFVAPLTLPPPDLARIREECDRAAALSNAIGKGTILAGAHAPCPDVLRALLVGLQKAAARGQGGEACVEAGVAAAIEVPDAMAEESWEGPMQSSFLPLLEQTLAAKNPPGHGGKRGPGTVDAAMYSGVVAVEQAAGARLLTAREHALELFAVKEHALRDVAPPPRVNVEELENSIERLVRLIGDETGEGTSATNSVGGKGASVSVSL